MTDLEYKLTVSLIRSHRAASERYLERVARATSGGEAAVLIQQADQHCLEAEALLKTLNRAVA